MKRLIIGLIGALVLVQGGVVFGAFNRNTDPNLVAYWTLDEGTGTLAADSSPAGGNSGTLKCTATTNPTLPAWVSGIFGGGVQFNGTNNYIDCGTGAALNPTGSFSVSLWANIGAWSSAWNNVMFSKCGENSAGWQLRQYSNTMFCFTTRGTGTEDFPSTVAPSLNQWIHITCVFDMAGGTKTIYFNGVQNAQVTGLTGTRIATTTNPAYIGARNIGSGPVAFFNGILDDVRAYNRALSAAEVTALLVNTSSSKGIPANKAVDVQAVKPLSWTPATAFAGKHKVYLGTDSVAVKNGSASVLVSAAQDANSYQPPSRLAWGTTYYWRVDELSTPPVAGNIWQFTTEPQFYIVGTTLGTATSGAITATASSTAVGWSAKHTVDSNGLTGDMHNTLSTSMWLNDPTKETGPYPYIQYTFDRVYYLDSMLVWNYNAEGEDLNGNGIGNALVQYSTSTDPNNIVWTTLNTFALNPAFGYGSILPTDTLLLGGIPAKYVRITAKSNQGGDLSIGVGLSEVRFYYRLDWARVLAPANNVTGLDPTKVVLGWRPGRDAISNNVNLGTDPNALTKVNSLPSASYSPTGLNFGTKYYWRIDEVNGTTTWPGILWSFTTQEYSYPPIDDMESYTNDVASGKAIFQTWADGYTNPAINGSQVGYGTGTSYVETTIVHSPKQSMPFFYTNTTAAISEATRTFTTGQDWTVSGADTLSPWVQGVPTSYLGLNNGMILMNGSGADISGTADAFHFAYKNLSGDGTIIAKVESVDATDVWSKAGVMIRATLDAGSMEAANVVSGSSGISFQYRPTAAAATTAVTVTGLKAPYWVKLTRTGDVFKAQQSPDGITWTDTTATPSTTIVMGTNVLIGLAVTSHNANLVAGARFSNISINGTAVSAGDLTVVDVGMTTPTPAGNKLDRFYVALEDSAAHRVEYSPDPYAVVAGTWQQWKIPLSAFSSAGVNVHSVKKMTIGVGDKTKPASGATGQLYIDDIMFGHPAQ